MREKDFNLILALDSSSRCLTFAAGGKNRKILHVETDKDFRHAETVVLQIDNLMKTAGLSLDEVDCLACGVGPGSFTGLRVGLAAVKALLISRNLPCFVMSSLDLIAENALGALNDQVSYVRVLVDARQSRYYTAEFKNKGSRLVKQGTDEILPIKEIVASMKKECAVLGDGIPSFTSAGMTSGLERLEFLPNSTWYPRAAEMVRLVLENSPVLRKVGIRKLEPAYLRPTEPEERLLELEKRKNG